VEKRYVVLYYDNYSGFRRRVFSSYDSWGNLINSLSCQWGIQEYQIVSISLDINNAPLDV
jgi:hypothetical protein